MESNQFTPTKTSEPSQSQPQGQKPKSTAAIVGILLGIAVVLFVVNAVMKKDTPVRNGNIIAWNQNSTVNENVNVKRTENTFTSPLTIKFDDQKVTLKFPEDCTLAKDESKNRAGAFVAYDGNCVLSEDGTVFFGGISLYSIDSINKFQDYSRNGGFWEGEWVGINDYQKQKISIEKKVSADDYILKDFNGKNFLVRTVIDKPGAGVSRSYVTYAKGVRVQIYLSLGMPINQEGMIDNQKLEEYNILADKLFGQKIELLN